MREGIKEARYEEPEITTALDFLTATLEARRPWNKAFKILEENYFQIRIPNQKPESESAKVLVQSEGGMKTFSDMQGCHGFASHAPSLRKPQEVWFTKTKK